VCAATAAGAGNQIGDVGAAALAEVVIREGERDAHVTSLSLEGENTFCKTYFGMRFV
jgi:hypothetical protein